MKTDYTGITEFLKTVETLNKAVLGEKETPNTDRSNQINKFAVWYKKQNPLASNRQISRAIDRKFWGK